MAAGRVRAPIQNALTCSNLSHELLRRSFPQSLRSLTTSEVAPSSQAPPLEDSLSQTNTLSSLSSNTSAPARSGSSIKSSPPILGPYQPPANPFITQAECALRAFPSLEPTRIISYPSTHLLLPLRKDILHRAVIFEGDSKRLGTASTKWRSEVHGSGRKVRRQKGTGAARLGDKKSPMLKGGGVAFGPKPRDFSTELTRKVYDLAFRTAVSHRYREGELMVTDGNIDLVLHDAEAQRQEDHLADLLKKLLEWHDLRGTTFVTSAPRAGLTAALSTLRPDYPIRAIQFDDIEVKSLLEGRRVIIERAALQKLFKYHQNDLVPCQRL